MTRRKADPAGQSEPSDAAAGAAAPETQEAQAPAKSRRRRARRTPVAERTTFDRVQVADNALATVVGLAAHEVPGVVGMAPASLSEGLRRILGVSQVDEGVEVERGDDGATARIVLHVVVAYGVNIPAVAESVVERVRYAAKTFAGVVVSDVKVRVAGVSRG